MPRYFYDIHDGKRFADKIGTICADLEGAQVEAVARLSRHLVKWRCKWNGGVWSLVIRDENSNVVGTIALSAESH